MKTKKQIGDCAFDSDTLDDWLENDLRQSGVLPWKDNKSNSTDKSNKYLKIEELADWEARSFCDGSDDKTVVGDSDHTPSSLSSSTQLPPILKAFLATLQQRQRGITMSPLLPFTSFTPSPASPSSLTPDSINPLHISKKPGIPSMSVTKTSASKVWIPKITASTAPTKKKRHRGMNNSPDSVNVMDPLVLKRLKNTDAARRSRQRKLMKMEGLQARVAELEKLNEQLRSQVTVAENTRDASKIKEAKLRNKVTALEAQLAEAHRSLLGNVKQKLLDSDKLIDGNDNGDSQQPCS